MFFHGTSVKLKVGDFILPPEVTGVIQERGRKKNLNQVFFTADIGSARIYAGRAKNALGGNQHYVYSVVPIGNVCCISNTAGATVFMAPQAVIVEIVTLTKEDNNRV